ncbi:MAG: serine--tRNA ligase, partial [Pseudomonadota bacterium]|nr:serine--tRNA ligase [Pseudomonadota bacterium]
MHDINLVRKNPEAFDKALQQRNAEPAAAVLIACDDARKAAIAKAQALQTTRNEASKKIGQAKGEGDYAAAEELMVQIAELKSALQEAEDEERKLKVELEKALSVLPNIPLADVPEGVNEDDNQEVRQIGEVGG